ncbi:MAG: XrtA-associated ATPase [Pseudomonadota bacterium]|nr:XrtA-associated ATPase [Pseudomonadota bacterium]
MYSDHFGLTAQPFQLTPDARFWFGSRTHKKAMAYLGYGLAQGEGFIVVTGEVGAGKSTLVGHLMATIDRARLNAVLIVSTQVEGDDMLRLAAQGLGLAVARVEKARLLDQVERRLEEEARAGKRTLLIVDEAQNLPVSALEELRMLSNFQIGGRALVQIFLLGQPEFRDAIASSEGLEQLRQRVIATHHLEAMGADEVEAYIFHRLEVAGWTGRPAFAAEAFPAIHRHSGGIPRRVNQLANRLMLFAAVEGAETIDAAAVEAVAADMEAERPERRRATREERVLPLRSVPAAAEAPRVEAPRAEPASISDLGVERRVAALEARVEEQEAALRRVLAMLVDWVENGPEEPGYRSNAA